MKIFADFYLYNDKKENILYNLNTKLSMIITDVNNFIKALDNNINFDILVIKWCELYEILSKNGDIPLFKLLRIKKKFKICYGGHIKFKIIYKNKEQITIFENSSNKNETNIYNKNKLFLVYESIIKYLTNDEKINLALINKYSYKKFLDNKLLKEDLFFKNDCFDEEEAQNKIINFKKIFGGPSLGLYEVKKLGMYVGEKYIYLLIQSIETYNVEIMRLNKSNLEEHEIIFRDNWTNYYLFDNTIYQLKYTKEKTKLNKIDKNDEINFVYINVSNYGEDFDSEYFYYHIETKEIYIVTSELKIYKYNKTKKKLKLFFDESKKLKKFNHFTSLCKIRKYWKNYKFIKKFFFLSLLKFYIFDITNKKLIITFPEIRGVESILKIDQFYYIVDYRFIYLLSNKNFEINNKIKKFNNDYCCNSLLRIDPFLNYSQSTLNDININKNEFKVDKKWIKKMKLMNLYFKFNDKYLCSDYYNDNKALFIKLYGIASFNNNISTECIKKIRINSNKFIKKLKFEDNIKDKNKKEIINNLKCHLFFNGLGDFIINMNEYFWIYHYIDYVNDNNINNNNNKEEFLYKYNNIIIKNNDIIRFHNIVFYDKHLIIWKPKSLKILYYNLSLDTNLKNNSKEDNNKFNKNVKILSVENIEGEKNVEIEKPIFIFKSVNDLYLITNFCEDSKSYDLLKIKIEKEKILLIDTYLIKMDDNNIIKNDEFLIYAKLILNEEYLIIFSSSYLYLYKNNGDKENIYKEIKRKEHNIIGYFNVKDLYMEETCFIAQDDRSKDCFFFDIKPWIEETINKI